MLLLRLFKELPKIQEFFFLFVKMVDNKSNFILYKCFSYEITYLYFYNLHHTHIYSLYKHFYNLYHKCIYIRHNHLYRFHSRFLYIPFLFYLP